MTITLDIFFVFLIQSFNSIMYFWDTLYNPLSEGTRDVVGKCVATGSKGILLIAIRFLTTIVNLSDVINIILPIIFENT